MNSDNKLLILRNTLQLSQAKLAEGLNVSQAAIANIEAGAREISMPLAKAIANKYNVDLNWLLSDKGEPFSNNFSTGNINVPYWEKLPEELKRPQITSVHCDLELIQSDWMRDTDNLRAIPMLGSSMNTYIIPLKDRNMLIMDLSSTDINKNGVYLFTTNEGNNLYIRFLSLLMDGSVKITAYENNEEKTKVLTPEQQKEFDFNVVGRILINASLTI